MTRNDLRRAVAMANDPEIELIAGPNAVDISRFRGFGLAGFAQMHCTIRELAALVRWQCCYVFGGLDCAALTEIALFGRQRFVILD